MPTWPIDLDRVLSHTNFSNLPPGYAQDLAHNIARGLDLELYFHRALHRNAELKHHLAHYNFRDLASSQAQALELSNNLTHGLKLKQVREGVHHFPIDLAIDLKRHLDSNLAYYRSIDFFSVLDFDVDCYLDFANAVEINHDFDIDLVRRLCSIVASDFDTYPTILALKYEKEIINWFFDVLNSIHILCKALLEGVVMLIDIMMCPIPKALLIALRQPGLLSPVDHFPANLFGIHDLCGNVWEWTTTMNEEGEHAICGGAWTEEKPDPAIVRWLPPEWRDIDLGFRCACDWDKIGEVKDIRELESENQNEE